MSKNDLDKVYITKLKSGSRPAFSYLYNEWSGKLYNFILSLSQGDSYIAEEITQAVFVEIWEKKEILDEEKSIGTLLYVIGKHKLINHYKHLMIESQYLLKQSSTPIYINSTDEDVEYRFLSDCVNKLISNLPPRQSLIYKMKIKQNYTNEEIANKLQISVNTVESQFTKANNRMRFLLSKYYDKILFLLIALYKY